MGLRGYSMKTTAKFGIIIPSIGRSSLLKALYSCKNQTFTDFNAYIVFNGCDPECLGNYLGKYDERFHFFFSEKKGVSHARNLGLEKCSDEYITWLDDDDELTLDALEVYNKIITKNPVDMVFAKNTVSIRDKNLIDCECNYYDDKNTIIFYEFKGKVRLGMASSLFRREAIKEIAFDEKVNFDEDQLFKIKCTIQSNSFCITSKVTHVVNYDFKRRGKMILLEYDKLAYTDYILNKANINLNRKTINAIRLRRANDLFYLLTQSIKTGLAGDEMQFKNAQRELKKLYFVCLFKRKGIKGKLLLPFLVSLKKSSLSKFLSLFKIIKE